ncbi:MAG: hypothetical protein FWH27_11990 [Planctomycetaceae bacterium]|nr:hypothetical protein [Planctomycetaceae bacterium]
MAKHRIETLLEKNGGKFTDRYGLIEDVLTDAATEKDGVTETPIRLNVRSGDWIDHPWFGRIITDFEGMSWHKKRLILDWNHNDNEEIGIITSKDHSNGNLVCEATLLSRDKRDRAAKIIDYSRHGMPYEVSMTWGRHKSGKMVFEDVKEGTEAKVNGKTVVGPGTIIRKWGMYGAAICPHGVDHSTTTTILDSERYESMEKDLKKFIDAFGKDQAVQYMLDANIKSFEDAEEEHKKFLDARREEKLNALIADQEKLQSEIKTLAEDRDKWKSEFEKQKTDFDKIKDSEKTLMEDKKKLEDEHEKLQAAIPGVTVTDSETDSSNRTRVRKNGETKGTYRDAMMSFFGV